MTQPPSLSQLTNLILDFTDDFPFTESLSQDRFINESFQLAYLYSQTAAHHSSQTLPSPSPTEIYAQFSQDPAEALRFSNHVMAAAKALVLSYISSIISQLQTDIELADSENEASLKQHLAAIYKWQRIHLYPHTT